MESPICFDILDRSEALVSVTGSCMSENLCFAFSIWRSMSVAGCGTWGNKVGGMQMTLAPSRYLLKLVCAHLVVASQVLDFSFLLIRTASIGQLKLHFIITFTVEVSQAHIPLPGKVSLVYDPTSIVYCHPQNEIHHFFPPGASATRCCTF